MGYGHANDYFPSPTRLKRLRELADSPVAPRYEPTIIHEVELLERQLKDANETLNKLADTLRTHRITNWTQVDSDYEHLKKMPK